MTLRFWPVVLSLAASTLFAVEDDGAVRNACKKNLQKIYGAIQQYRAEHKSLPSYLHDLVPQYVSGDLVFRCPAAEGKDHPFAHLKDAQLNSDYLYEFSVAEAGRVWGAGRMTMIEMKMLQMAVVGGAVPILRCHFHNPVLNIGFDGEVFESPLNWEELHYAKIAREDLQPLRIRARMLRSLGEGAGDEVAFELLRESASVVPGPDSANKALAAYEKTAAFLRKYPSSSRTNEARQMQRQLLFQAAYSGSAEARFRLFDLACRALNDGDVAEADAFELNFMSLNLEKGAGGRDFVQKVRDLMEYFPNRSEPYRLLLTSMDALNQAERRKILENVIGSKQAPEEAKRLARSYLRKAELKGNEVEIAFTALDGRQVDVTKLKGKVVLIDFWATWCGPCVTELPSVQAVYDRFHDKGFEIIGISFDNNRSALETFVKSREMPWPQYFDGKGWQNSIGQEYAIESIPTMWLVGRDGKVSDLNARQDLEMKIERLLGQ